MWDKQTGKSPCWLPDRDPFCQPPRYSLPPPPTSKLAHKFSC